jgi:hypothetical protein
MTRTRMMRTLITRDDPGNRLCEEEAAGQQQRDQILSIVS